MLYFLIPFSFPRNSRKCLYCALKLSKVNDDVTVAAQFLLCPWKPSVECKTYMVHVYVFIHMHTPLGTFKHAPTCCPLGAFSSLFPSPVSACEPCHAVHVPPHTTYSKPPLSAHCSPVSLLRPVQGTSSPGAFWSSGCCFETSPPPGSPPLLITEIMCVPWPSPLRGLV